jgi:hypothetical protein
MLLPDRYSSDFVRSRDVNVTLLSWARVTLLLLATLSVGCSRAAGDNKPASALTGLDLLCSIWKPTACNPGPVRDLYLSPPDTQLTTTFRSRAIVVPMGYVSDLALIGDSRYPNRLNTHLPLVALGHELAPRSRSNAHEFFVPFDQRLIQIRIGARGPAARPWVEVARRPSASTGEILRPVSRPPQFGLSIVGEDFDRFPNRKPCARLGDDERFCRLQMNDTYKPIEPNGSTSVMACTAQALPDPDAELLAMSSEQQKEYVESKKWVGRRRTMCYHEMYYEPWDAHVALRYPRHLLPNWRAIENNLRRLLESFEVAGQAAASAPSVPRR